VLLSFSKVDTEGAEVAVLQGIEEGHRPIFRQVAVEAHSAPLQEQVCAILAQHGLRTTSELGLASPEAAVVVCARRP
jgi:hypothetical protein